MDLKTSPCVHGSSPIVQTLWWHEKSGAVAIAFPVLKKLTNFLYNLSSFGLNTSQFISNQLLIKFIIFITSFIKKLNIYQFTSYIQIISIKFITYYYSYIQFKLSKIFSTPKRSFNHRSFDPIHMNFSLCTGKMFTFLPSLLPFPWFSCQTSFLSTILVLYYLCETTTSLGKKGRYFNNL